MTQTIAALSSHPRFGVREAGLWTSAAAIILAAHVAVAYAVQNLSFAEVPDGGSPPALAVEMAPMVIAPAVPEDVATLDAVTPDPPDAAEETPTVGEAKPMTEPAPAVEEAESVTEQPVDTDNAKEAEPAEPTVAALSEQQPLEEVVPDAVEAIAPDVVVPLPQPKPVDTDVKA
ncbi:energy transducer TonB, partial [Mesorhizobium sp. USDA-HM6]